MEDSLFYKGFDMESFIDRRLLDIENLNDRRYAREILKEVFWEITQYTQTAYQELEQKMEQGFGDKKDYCITTGVMDSRLYDETDERLFPMKREDLPEEMVSVEELRSSMEQKRSCKVFSIFLEADYTVIKGLMRSGEQFACVIKTADGEYTGSVSIRPREDYQEILTELFRTFQNNGIAYQCPCAPYLTKFFDVYVESGEVNSEEEITSIVVDFREYEPYVRYHMIPVWNIEKVAVPADMEPEACIDEIHYCHTINGGRLKQDSLYLIAEPDIEIYEINQGEDLRIVTIEQEKAKWQLLRMTSAKPGKLPYPVFSNKDRKKDGLVRTEAGIFQFINMLGYQDYVTLKRIQIIPEYSGEANTYCMDASMLEELNMPRHQDVLLLEFESGKQGDFLTDDIMSYLVTALQKECREYKCLGTFY